MRFNGFIALLGCERINIIVLHIILNVQKSIFHENAIFWPCSKPIYIYKQAFYQFIWIRSNNRSNSYSLYVRCFHGFGEYNATQSPVYYLSLSLTMIYVTFLWSSDDLVILFFNHKFITMIILWTYAFFMIYDYAIIFW